MNPPRPPAEHKLVLPRAALAAATNFLAAVCRPDPRHAEAIVWSLYFDTAGDHLLAEKLASDLMKTKLRLRWYQTSPAGRPVASSADAAGGGRATDPLAELSGALAAAGARPTEAAFLEVKRRIGDGRRKRRLAVDPTLPTLLAGCSWRAPRLAELVRLALPLFAADGTLPPPDLRPVLLVRYHRRRLIEPATGARVAIDADLAGELGPEVGRRRVALPVGVVEVKDRPPAHDADAVAGLPSEPPSRDLPPTLLPLIALGARRGPFSKYAALRLALAGEDWTAGSLVVAA